MPELGPQDLLERLSDWMVQASSVLVCYSGGIDSALVLAVASRTLGGQARAMTAVSPSLAASEKADAARVAHILKARHDFVESNELARPGYVANGPDRCFHCKSELYALAAQKARDWQLAIVVNGTNVDDLGDYRPGLQAASDAGVRSPLVELGFTKADVRAVSRLLELPIWDKPAAACLSSRIPYGTAVTRERLAQIGELEAELKALGFRQVRVRLHDKLARIELELSDLPELLAPGKREAVLDAGRRLGFLYVTLDLGGYRTGSHNEVLAGRSLKLISS